jgi:hypothetical protein
MMYHRGCVQGYRYPRDDDVWGLVAEASGAGRECLET